MRGRTIITERTTGRFNAFESEETHEKVRITLNDALAELTLPQDDELDAGASDAAAAAITKIDPLP